jgi:hypothetical protein
MEHGWLSAIEQSWLGVAARESVWLYPTANVTHILTLTVFAASVAMMDARLLGAFQAIAPGPFLRVVRPLAVGALITMMLTGSVLFAAEAPHVAVNPVFQTKLALIGLAVVNALIFELASASKVRALSAGAPMPGAVRLSALVSLFLWLTVAASGRLIAYF